MDAVAAAIMVKNPGTGSDAMVRLLIVEFDADLSGRLDAALREAKYTVLHAGNADEAMSVLDKNSVQLIVANSACGGIEMTSELRDAENTVPVIILTADAARSEMRRIFRSGADGYMTLPLDLEELLMRIQSLLWRCNVVDEASLRFGSCLLHSQTLTVETRTGEIELRRMEFLLLEKLLSYPGRIFTRPQLMDDLWGYENDSDPRTVDTHIRRLRKKLHDVEDIRIQTVRGLGYRAVMPRRIRRELESE